MSNYTPLECLQSCHLCTYGDCDVSEHPCNICEYDPVTGVNSQFREILCHEIHTNTRDANL
jgi:CO dehydrogenase/acetyl-CoA synthase alpha subunit